MNKSVKRIISAVLVASVVASVAGCSLFDKANKLCTAVGDEFIQAALEREIEDMADLCTDDDEALDLLEYYEEDNEAIDLFLSRATFEVSEAECSTKKGKGTIEYVITLPDWDAALDEDPEDEDELDDILDDLEDKTEITVSIDFKLKKDKWLIDNVDEFIDDFYGELYDIDFPFESPLAEHCNYSYWYYCDDSDSAVYTNVDQIDLDIGFDDSDMYYQVYYTVAYEGSVVYTSEIGHYMGYYDSWHTNSNNIYDSNGYLPAGVYTISFYDADGLPVYSDSCTVNNTYN